MLSGKGVSEGNIVADVLALCMKSARNSIPRDIFDPAGWRDAEPATVAGSIQIRERPLRPGSFLGLSRSFCLST